MLSAGNTFLMPCGSTRVIAHLWIVISEPNSEQKVLIVSVTTQRPYSDSTIILNAGDHPFINRSSVVSYKDSMIRTVSEIQQAMDCGVAILRQDCSSSVLEKIKSGFTISPFVPGEILQFYIQQFPSR